MVGINHKTQINSKIYTKSEYKITGKNVMKLLIINGSPRRQNTWKIVERVKETINNLDDNVTFNEIDLIEENIPSCIGCYKCFNDGEECCPHSSVIEPIVEEMKSCDGLIITSPVYALNVTGVMKNFIDHIAYFYHRPYFFKHKALVIVTTAGAGHKKVGKYLDETLGNMGYNQRYDLFFIHSHDAHGYLPLKTKQTIDKESVKFYSSIKENRLTRPDFKSMVMYNVWRAMAKSNTIKRDNKYWTETGLINHEYSPDVPCNAIKKLIMKIFYRIMLKFLSKNTVESE